MNTENNYYNWEICSICTRKTRRSDCLVCGSCRPWLDRIDKRNAKILASEDITRSIVDVFRLVIIRGRASLRQLQKHLAEAIDQKEKKSADLWEKAGTKTASLLRQREVQHISDKALYEARVEILKNLKSEDKEFHQLCGEVVKWEKSVESLQIYLAGIEKKRKEYQEKKETTKAQETAVV